MDHIKLKSPKKVTGENWSKWDFYRYGPKRDVKGEKLEAFRNLW